MAQALKEDAEGYSEAGGQVREGTAWPPGLQSLPLKAERLLPPPSVGARLLACRRTVRVPEPNTLHLNFQHGKNRIFSHANPKFWLLKNKT